MLPCVVNLLLWFVIFPAYIKSKIRKSFPLLNMIISFSRRGLNSSESLFIFNYFFAFSHARRWFSGSTLAVLCNEEANQHLRPIIPKQLLQLGSFIFLRWEINNLLRKCDVGCQKNLQEFKIYRDLRVLLVQTLAYNRLVGNLMANR